MQMRLSASALNNGNMVMEKEAALASKLARTYAMQLERLEAMRGRRRTAKQSITVRKELHQHVHYHDARGGADLREHPHEPRTTAIGQCATLPSPQPCGEVVPIASGARKACV